MNAKTSNTNNKSSGLGNLGAISNLVNQARGNPGKILREIPLAEIAPKEQLRTRFTGIDELAQSLRSVGQQQPIVVSPKNPDGKYVIQKGERRYRAAILAGLETLDCIVREPNENSARELISEMAENIQRENYHPLEIARGIHILIEDHGYKKADVAAEMGKSAAYVTTHLKLLELSAEALELVEDNVIRDVTALNHLVTIQQNDPDLARDLCSIARSRGITRRQLEDHAKQVKDGAAPQQAAATTVIAEAAQPAPASPQPVEIETGKAEMVAIASQSQTTPRGTAPANEKPKAIAATATTETATAMPIVSVIWASPDGDVAAELDLTVNSTDGLISIRIPGGQASVESDSIRLVSIKNAIV